MHRFAADGQALPLARILVRHWLAEEGLEPPAADELLFVANELSTHAVGVHPGGWCQLDAWDAEGHVHLAVTGRPAPEARQRASSHLAPGTLALDLLNRLCHRVEIDDEAGAVSVSVRRPADGGRSGGPRP